MKKIVLTYGLAIGAYLGIFLLVSMQFYDESSMNLQYGKILGYSSMILGFIFIFFALKKYRELSGGKLSFGRGLAIGLLITLLASAIYSLAWTVYTKTIDDSFMDSYQVMQEKEWKEQGMSEEEIQAQFEEYASMMEMYDNPVFRFLFTIIEPLPPGIIISFFLALILMKKVPEEEMTA